MNSGNLGIKMITKNGFQQIIKGTTRVNENSSTIIDHIYVNKTQKTLIVVLLLLIQAIIIQFLLVEKLIFNLKEEKELIFQSHIGVGKTLTTI